MSIVLVRNGSSMVSLEVYGAVARVSFFVRYTEGSEVMLIEGHYDMPNVHNSGVSLEVLHRKY